MIKGPKKPDLTIEWILDKVSEYEIYRYYIGHDFVLGKTFCSPFRKENDPSFSITVSKDDRLHHLDYADSLKRGDCVDFVCQLFIGMNYDSALKMIAKDFGLISPLGEKREKVIIEYKEPTEKLFQVVVRKDFTPGEAKYWSDYHLGIDELRANNVYAVKKLYIDRELIRFTPGELVFGYFVEELGKWKIYRPFAPKEYKWRTNLPHNYISGLSRIINNCEKGVITKAKKDEMVLAKFLPNVASVQSESTICIRRLILISIVMM
jgi:hypothetical protein